MGKITAKWQGVVIAEADENDVVTVEGNSYFPPSSLKRDHFQDSTYTSVCGWKGDCSYYDVVVEGSTNKSAAWYYPDPKPAAENIKGYVAFWKGVTVGN